MKKQILFLVLSLLAIFSGVSTSFGQALAGSVPRGINCTDDAMHPIAGKKYIYKASSNQVGNYTFWSTKDMNFIATAAGVTTTNIATKLTTPTDLLTASANYATANALDNVEITWSDAILNGTTTAAPTFVAVNQDGTCANNLKVWSIIPIKAFTVDIRNIDNSNPTGTPKAFDATDDQCFDIVKGAKYNAVSSAMEYDFGNQVLYFEVIAANFTNSWTPTFTLSGLGNGQTAVIEWAYDAAFSNPATPIIVTSGTPSATPVSTAVTSTTLGVSIYVRVTIKNNTFEGLASTSVALAVDGVNSVNEWDIENNTLVAAGPLCGVGALNDKMDVATQILNPRPTVTPVAPSTPFVPGNETN